MSQLGVYRTLFREFVEDAEPGRREANRKALLASFGPQLEKMAEVKERIPEVSQEELAAATKLANEVLRLYKGLPAPREEPKVQIVYVPYYPCPPQRSCFSCCWGWR